MDEDKKPARAGGEQIKGPEVSAQEQRVDFKEEAGPTSEKREPPLQQKKLISDQLKREIEVMELDETLIEEAKKKAKQIEFLAHEGKIEHLLKAAEEKGVVYAVRIAKKMNDDCFLDNFHDFLAREGYYQKFIK